MKKLEVAEAFEAGAKWIEEYGWWGGSGGTGDPDNRTCISLAPLRASESRRQLTDYRLQLLVKHFGVTGISDVYNLNDTKSIEEGPQWAVDNLRAIAKDLRETTKYDDLYFY
jgi:hypothetical protein